MRGFEPGASFGRYEIIRKLADGGMAEIYLARVMGPAGFEKLVVLKRIPPRVAKDRVLVSMFVEEAQLAATLRHPNIADVFDVGSVNEDYFFAMEYVYGHDARRIRYEAMRLGQPIPIEVSLSIGRGISAALAYAHDRAGPDGPLGIVHRDISPSNILVSYDGAIKLVDFGIARATSRTIKTLTGILKGKLPYMSPEQCRSRVLDRRSDLFSLGIVLYELTTGVRPFRGNGEFEILHQIATAPITPPGNLVPGYPPALDAMVMKLLDRDLDYRYQNADEVLRDLEALISSLGVFMAEHVVSKYMRELFAEIAAWERAAALGVSLAYHVTNTPDPTVRNTLLTPSPLRHARAFPVPAPTPGARDLDHESTSTFDRVDRPYAHLEPEQASTTSTAPFSTGLRAPTVREVSATQTDVLGFDPSAADGGDNPDLGDGAPRGASRDDRIRRRIEALVDRAFAWYGANELEKAVTTAELALSQETVSPAAESLLSRHSGTLLAILGAYVGDSGQVPVLARPAHELEQVPFGQGFAFLLSRIDGRASIEQLVHISPMSLLETYRQLAQLIRYGALTLTAP